MTPVQVKVVEGKVQLKEEIAAGQGKVLGAVTARVKSAKGWFSLSKAKELTNGDVELCSKDGKVKVTFGVNGELAASTESVAVQQIHFVLAHLAFEKCFTQGYQTWNLSSTGVVGKDKRKKRLLSKAGLSGMFHDTDSPVWNMTGGMDSNGVIVLGNETKDADKKYLMLGSPTSRTAVSTFYIAKKNSTTLVKYVLDFGSPGLKAHQASSEQFMMVAASRPELLLEHYAVECKRFQNDNAEDKSLAMESPLRDLGRAPVGWGSWYEFYEKVTAKDVHNVLDAFKKDEQLKRTIDVFQLDDGYQLNTGDWLENQPRFGEDKLSTIATAIKKEGFVPGLWVAPFIASKTSKVFKDHPDWFLKRVDNPTKYVVAHRNPAWKRGGWSSIVMYCLDLSNEEVLAHLENVFRTLAQDWDFFKVDFLAAGMREGIRKNEMTRVEAYIKGCQALRRGIGATSFLLGCGAPLLASMQSNCFDSMRVSCDTAERWHPSSLLRPLVGDWEPPSCSFALWGNMTRYFMHGELWKFNDPDCLVLRRKGSTMTEHEVKTQVTVLGLTGGLLLFTDNMATLEEDRKALAFGVLPTTPLRGKPITGLMDRNSPPSTFALGDVDDMHAYAVVAHLNWSNAASIVTAARSGYDFWNNRLVNKGGKVKLPPHGVCALQARKKKSMVVGTTLHLTALTDGRIIVKQTVAPDTKLCTCVVSGSNEFVLHQGTIVLDTAALVTSSSGISVSSKSPTPVPGGGFAFQVSITDAHWTLVFQEAEPDL